MRAGGGGLKGNFLDTTQGQRNEKYNKNQPFKSLLRVSNLTL